MLSGYQLYEVIDRNNFYNIKGIDDTNFYFNYLADSLGRSNIAEFLGVDLEKENPAENIKYNNLQEWTNWLFNKDLSNKIIGDIRIRLNIVTLLFDSNFFRVLTLSFTSNSFAFDIKI